MARPPADSAAPGSGGPAVADDPEPTPEALRRRLAAVRPAEYARTRNDLEGAVTGLSPYLTHGFIDVPGVIAALRRRGPLDRRDRLVFELGWREYFRAVWRVEGERIFASLRAGPLPEAAYQPAVPADVAEGRTGLAVVDQAVRALHAHGHLHNHARLWLASYLVHLRKVHWRAGADWLYGQLIDGDLASNHLSWQWVAGTASRKPYLFDAANVARHAPPDWHVAGSALDRPREVLERVATTAEARLEAAGETHPGSPPPSLLHAPPPGLCTLPDAAAVAGRDVWLVHPWSIADPPPGRLPVAVCDAAFHARWPWTARRWRFVGTRLAAIAPLRWLADGPALCRALAAARSVAGVDDPHLGGVFDGFALAAPRQAFEGPERPGQSFSAWWAGVALRPAD